MFVEFAFAALFADTRRREAGREYSNCAHHELEQRRRRGAPLTPNLLADYQALFSATLNDTPLQLANKVADLYDGKADAPALPWVSWTNINQIESGWQGPMTMIFDTFRTQIRLTGITLVEDPKHPESWLRDANLEYWDVAKSQWIFGASLLSNSATHTHTLAKPIEAAKFRLVKFRHARRLAGGNIRLAKSCFTAKSGCFASRCHRKRPRAVLFDEGDDLLTAMFWPDTRSQQRILGRGTV